MQDNELIYLFVNELNNLAFSALYHKYFFLINYIENKCLKGFPSIPLEKNDLQSFTYFLFVESIYLWKEDKRKTFKNYLFNYLFWGLYKELRHYSNKKHQVLNWATYYDEAELIYESDQEKLIQLSLLKEGLSSFTDLEKAVWDLKWKGYNNYEMQKSLDLTYKQVDNAFQRAIYKTRKIMK